MDLASPRSRLSGPQRQAGTSSFFFLTKMLLPGASEPGPSEMLFSQPQTAKRESDYKMELTALGKGTLTQVH
jgi:hypothetical protein